MTELVFLSNEADEDEGLGHAGIETYKDAPYASTARECGQNSSDAAVGKPVKISFDVVDVAQSDLPSRDQFIEAVNSCLQKAKENEDEKSIDFFRQADALLKAGSIKVLRISDTNTRGLIGPSKPGTPFHSLVKATGVSRKESETSGGSFGIGKNAVFAISDLQTVFYSTCYPDEDSGEEVFLAQGKSILISHEGPDGAKKRATGYWGSPGFMAVDSVDDVPAWLQRQERGTSVFAIGFRESGDWAHRMAASLIRNFFCAIHRGAMEFSINSAQIELNRDSLPMAFNSEEIEAAAEDSGQAEDFMFSKHLYDCLTSVEAPPKSFTLAEVGEISVRILVREGLPKRVGIIRNGMMITDSLEKFGDKFSRFSMNSDFVAFVEPVEDKGSTFLKKLENPRHDGLSAERLADEEKRRTANTEMKKFARRIRDAIKSETYIEPEDEEALDELSEFFADNDDVDRLPESDGEDDPETYTYKPAETRKPKPRQTTSDGGDEGGAGGEGKGKGGGGGGKGKGHGDGAGGTGDQGRAQPVHLGDIRNFLEETDQGVVRRLFFTPEKSGEVAVRIRSTGISERDDLMVLSSDIGEIVAGKIQLSLTAGDRASLEVQLAEEYDGPIELDAVTVAVPGGKA